MTLSAARSSSAKRVLAVHSSTMALAVVAWVLCAAPPAGSQIVTGVQRPTTSPAATIADLKQIHFGDHSFAREHNNEGRVLLIACFGKPNGSITLTDKANKSMVTRASCSQPLARLEVPSPNP